MPSSAQTPLGRDVFTRLSHGCLGRGDVSGILGSLDSRSDLHGHDRGWTAPVTGQVDHLAVAALSLATWSNPVHLDDNHAFAANLGQIDEH